MIRTNSKDWNDRRIMENKQRKKLNVIKTLSVSGNKKDVFAILKNLKEKYGNTTIQEILNDWQTDRLEFC